MSIPNRDYYTSIHAGNSELGNQDFRRAFDTRYANYCRDAQQILCSGKAGGRSLSLGCGIGYDVQEFLKLGYDAYGFEVTELTDVWQARLGADAARCTVSADGELPYEDGTFDLITSVCVLEHVAVVPPHELVTEETLPGRRYYVQQAIRKLAPGGLFILTYPNRGYPYDSGHSHHYIPGSAENFGPKGYTPTDPWHPMNFIPAMSELVHDCRDMNVSLGFLADDFLFGPNGPEREDPGYTNRLVETSQRWSQTTGEPLSHARRPHIQAFIVKGSMTPPDCGAWEVEWVVEGQTWRGELIRLAFQDKWLLAMSSGSSRECWECVPASDGSIVSTGGAKFFLDRLEARPPIGDMTLQRKEEAFWPAISL